MIGFLSLGILSFGLGVGLNSFLSFNLYVGVFLAGIGLFFGFFYFLSKNEIFVFLAIFLLMTGLGMFRYELKDRKSVSPDLKRSVEKQIILEGVIVNEPEKKEKYTRFVFKAGTKDKILIMTSHYPEFSYGDAISVKGKLKKPENLGDFDWKAYLAKDDVFLQIPFPEITLVEKGKGNFFKRFLFSLKNKYIGNLESLLPEPQSSLLSGLTVGEKESMGPELLEKFRRTGIIHIVVLSGYNVTIIADNIARFFNLFLSKIVSVVFGLAGIFVFALLTGASSTVVRASIMASLVYIARATGRVYETTIALFIAGFFMLLINPKILRFDPSFQLSFLATISLIFVAPRLENYFWWLPDKWKIKEYGLATISAQLMVAPFLLQTMGIFSLSALPVNLLILIFIPVTMFFGFLSGVVGWISLSLAMIPAAFSHLLLSYELWVVDVFSKISLSAITVSHFPFELLILIYLGILLFIIFKKPIQR